MQTVMEEVEVEEAEVLHEITQVTRFTLIQNILAHPKGAPSTHEIDYANPSKSKGTLTEHLQKLEEIGVIESVRLPQEERSRDLPHVFWTITEDGRNLLDRHDLLAAEETLQQSWERLEKTAKVERYQDAPRPNEV